MTETNINFNKRKLESLKSSAKPTWYYAKNFEGLALREKKYINNADQLMFLVPIYT